MQQTLTGKLRALMKLVSNRLRLVQEKKRAIAKQDRRQIAELLKQGRTESAKIKVEGIIQEDLNAELLEYLEIYSELVLARAVRIENNVILDDRLSEAIHVLIYAQPFVDIKELVKLKPLVAQLVSKQFVQECSESQEDLPPRVLSRIHVDVPSQELVDLYLVEICKAYSISVPGVYECEVVEDDDVTDEKPQVDNDDEKDTSNDIWARFEALKK